MEGLNRVSSLQLKKNNGKKGNEEKKKRKEGKKNQIKGRTKGKRREKKNEQVTRGHNIVADGWAGASNPYRHRNPPPTLKHTREVSKTFVFPLQIDAETKTFDPNP